MNAKPSRIASPDVSTRQLNLTMNHSTVADRNSHMKQLIESLHLRLHICLKYKIMYNCTNFELK